MTYSINFNNEFSSFQNGSALAISDAHLKIFDELLKRNGLLLAGNSTFCLYRGSGKMVCNLLTKASAKFSQIFTKKQEANEFTSFKKCSVRCNAYEVFRIFVVVSNKVFEGFLVRIITLLLFSQYA